MTAKPVAEPHFGTEGDQSSLAGGNAADPQQVKQKGNKIALARARYTAGMRRAMQTAEGREVFWTLLERCCVFQTIMADPQTIYANAGRHDFGLELMGDLIHADEAGYLQMQKEAMERKRRDTVSPRETRKPEGDDTDG